MKRIVATLKTADTGPLVVDLQDALLFIFAHPLTRSGESPRSVTAEELAALIERVREERAEQVFGKATQALVQILQVQQGLGDGLIGVVEERTAEMFNGLLKARASLNGGESIDFLAELRPDEWVELVYTHGVPGGSSSEEYVTALVAEVEKHFPTSSPAVDSVTGKKLRPSRWEWWRHLSLWRRVRKWRVGR